MIVLGQTVSVLVFLHVTGLLHRIRWAQIALSIVVSFPPFVDDQLFPMQMFMVARMFVRMSLQFDKKVMRDGDIFHLPGHARHHGHACDCVCGCDDAHGGEYADPANRNVGIKLYYYLINYLRRSTF